jgi:hypothetical protein
MKLEVGQVWYRIWNYDSKDIDSVTILEVSNVRVKFKIEYFNNEPSAKIREWYHSTFMDEFTILDSKLIRELL